MSTPARVRQDRTVITEPAKRRSRKGAPPRPRAHPVLGSALDLRRSQAETYARVMREHGDVVRLAAGPPGLRVQLYCVFHPDGVRQVLAGSRDGYTKRNRFYVQIAEAVGWGLLTTEGERWQRQRRLIQPLFTRKQIAGYANLMAGEAAAVARQWESAARDGASVDAHAEMVRLTLRVVGRSIFGDEVRAGCHGSRLGVPGAQPPHVPPGNVTGGHAGVLADAGQQAGGTSPARAVRRRR